MHDGKFSRSLRLGATRFARVYGEGLRENRKNFAQNCKKSARDFKAKYLQNRKNFAPSGFTIIEVALVLAIAGLIFLVVFLALPALQRSQRDTARRQDVANGVVAVQQFYADGGAPSQITRVGYSTIGSGTSPLDPYLKNAGLSPSTERKYTNQFYDGYTYPDMGVFDFFFGSKCGDKDPGGGVKLVQGSPSDVAVSVRLEEGSTTTSGRPGANIYCVDAGR